MRALVPILLVGGGLPLLIYPFVVLINLMQLAGHRTGHEPAPLLFMVGLVMLGTTLYPAVYLPCMILSLRRFAGNRDRAALRLSIIPLVYLVAVAGAMALWIRLEG